MSANLQIDYSKTLSCIGQADIDNYKAEVAAHLDALYKKSVKARFLGWVNLPSTIKVEN
jgi:hypothetical protein